MIKGLLFDLDGVLVDTARFHFQAWKKLAQELGTDITIEQNEKLKGVSRVDSLNYILEWGNISLSETDKQAALIKKNAHYLSLCDNLTAKDCLPGVLNLLADAGEMGLELGVGSASKNALYILKKLQISTYLDCLIDGTKTTKGKPDPQVFLMGAQELRLDPWQIIVFEDAPKGVDAGLAGGFHVVGIGQEENLSRAHVVLPGFENTTLKDIVNQFEG
jgi:beta-phosphoglucomutase